MNERLITGGLYTPYRSLPSTGLMFEAFSVLNRLPVSIWLDETRKGLCAMKGNSFHNYNYNSNIAAGMKCVFVWLWIKSKIATTQVWSANVTRSAHTTKLKIIERVSNQWNHLLLPVNFFIDYVLVLKFPTVLLLHLLYYALVQLQPVDPSAFVILGRISKPIQKPTISS